MADDEEKSEGGGGGDTLLYQWLAELALIVLALLALSRILPAITAVISGRGSGTGIAWLDTLLTTFYYNIVAFLLFFTIASNVASVVLIMLIVYAVVRLTELNKSEEERLSQVPKASLVPQQSKQWMEIVERINSDNPSDWRLAIIDADIILDDLLTKIGCSGMTIGDKLQQVEKADFVTLDNAWEAHKVRNSVAHEGQEFLLSKREAQRVIRLYESVFQEFHYV